MKIKSVMLSVVAAMALMFSSCEQDNEGVIYNQTNQGASFLFNTVSASAPASNPIVYVSVIRANTKDAATVGVVGEVKTAGVTGVVVAPTVSFAVGEQEGLIAVDLGPNLAVGQKVQVALTINDNDASVGGVKTATLTTYKEYEWENIGKGIYVDNWVCGVVEHEVQIMQAKGFPRYRVMDPYGDCLKNDDGEWTDWIEYANRCKYVEFWENGDGTVAFDAFKLGLNYQADQGSIVAYPYTAFNGIESDKSMKLDEGFYQLAPYIYIDGVGGWNYTQTDGVILIALP